MWCICNITTDLRFANHWQSAWNLVKLLPRQHTMVGKYILPHLTFLCWTWHSSGESVFPLKQQLSLDTFDIFHYNIGNIYIITIKSEVSTFPIVVIFFHGYVPEVVVPSYVIGFIYILSIIFHTVHRAVCIQFTHVCYDGCESTCTLSYYHQQIGSMINLPLFKVTSWNNGMRSMSFYILILMINLHIYIYIYSTASH